VLVARHADRLSISVAWLAGLIASNLAVVVWVTVLGQPSVPIWLGAVELVVLTAIASLMTQRNAPRPLLHYFWMLPAIMLGQIAASAVSQTDIWISWARQVPAVLSFSAANGLKILPATTLALTFIGSGLTRADLFLTIGELRARVRRRRTTMPWGALTVIAIPITTLPVLANVVAVRHPELPLSVALTLAPVIVFGATANTLLEEFVFRQGLLARLVPALGEGHALGITSLRFGIGHWFGNPSGPIGVLLATILGVFAGKCMLDCRGSGWVWLLHWIDDLVIFTVIALTVVYIPSP
jgi:membrane protease YdiL (CAAX protease family)